MGEGWAIEGWAGEGWGEGEGCAGEEEEKVRGEGRIIL